MVRRIDDRRNPTSDECPKKERYLLPRINLPPWLKREFEFLFFDDKTAEEKKDWFFARMAETYKPESRGYKRIQKAYDIVEREFEGIVRDDGDNYLDHLVESALIAHVHLHIRDADIICGILLHDIVEDIEGWTWVRVRREFNKKIAKYVRRNTKPRIGGRIKSKPQRDRIFREQLWNADHESIIVRLCEAFHNLIKMWRTDEERIRRRLRASLFYLRLARRERILSFEFKTILSFIEGRLDK